MGGLLDSIAKDRGQPATVRIGTVVSVNPVVVSVQGTGFIRVGMLGSFSPSVGQVVALLGQSAVSSDGSSWLALGRLDSNTAGPSRVGATGLTNATGTQNSGTYANAPGVTVLSFIKRSAFTSLWVRWGITFFTDAAATGPGFGVLVNGVDYDVSALFPSLTPNVRLQCYGEREITGLPAGALTVTGRWRRVAGAGTLNMVSAAEWSSMTVEEL